MITYGTRRQYIIQPKHNMLQSVLWSGNSCTLFNNSPPDIPPRDEGANPSDEATKATNINSDEMKRFIVLYGTVNSVVVEEFCFV